MTDILEPQYEAFEYQIYTCKADFHHHIITGPNNASWPFWSCEAAFKMLEHLRWMIGPSISEGEEQKIQQLYPAINRLARMQKRDERGRFGRKLMPRKLMYREGPVAYMWQDLYSKKEPRAYCIDQTIAGDMVMPLYCDFVQRAEERPSGSLSKREWEKLAEETVKPLTAKDLGIVLTLS